MHQFGPLKRKHGPTGAPADHFAPWRNRHAAVDHLGRITALVADGETDETAPVEDPFADLRADGDGENWLPPIGYEVPLDNAELRTRLLEALTETGAEIDVDKHPNVEFADYATWQLEHFFSDHEAKTVTHSHEHSAMGDQGDDEMHTHMHSHSGDASHSHAHDDDGDEAAAKPESRMTVTKVEPGTLGERVAELRERQKRQGDAERMSVRAFKRADQKGDPAAGIEIDLAVKIDGDKLVTALDSDRFGLVAAGADVPQIVDNPGAAWHAYLCVEGLRTDEFPSRELVVGGGAAPDLPVSMRYLVEDEGGHYGAITCGRIDKMERQEVEGYNVWYAEGVFGTDENSQIAQLNVEEQTQRFVSIDPRDVECEIIEVEISVSTGGMFDEAESDELVDWWVRYNSYVIGAATIVATPALQQAVITMAGEDLPWADLATERAPQAPAIVASAGGERRSAPAEWFADPGFHVGDPRLIRQRDGRYAAPLTVSDDGRISGHVAYWGAEHTGFPGRKVTPPHSPTYAYFETGVYRTAEGEDVPVGQITMGCGHASTSMDFRAAAAHYDGGYGAVQMADVRVGEDDFGIWVAGALRPLKNADNPAGPTAEQVAQFRALGLSGDWRQIAGRKHFVACLAVPVQGFPISREALVASGSAEIDARAVRAGLDEEGEIISLVAAGRVHRLPPDERLAALEQKVDVLLDAEAGERRREAALAARERLQRLTGGDV